MLLTFPSKIWRNYHFDKRTWFWNACFCTLNSDGCLWVLKLWLLGLCFWGQTCFETSKIVPCKTSGIQGVGWGYWTQTVLHFVLPHLQNPGWQQNHQQIKIWYFMILTCQLELLKSPIFVKPLTWLMKQNKCLTINEHVNRKKRWIYEGCLGDKRMKVIKGKIL